MSGNGDLEQLAADVVRLALQKGASDAEVTIAGGMMLLRQQRGEKVCVLC